MAVGRIAGKIWKGALNATPERAIGRGLGRAAMTTGGATAIGAAIAFDRENMSTFALDTLDESLTGRTDTDVVFTGGERGLFSGYRHELSGRLPGPRVPWKYLNASTSGYAGALQKTQNAPLEVDDWSFERYRDRQDGGEPFPQIPNAGIYSRMRHVDGSLVFGMNNLK